MRCERCHRFYSDVYRHNCQVVCKWCVLDLTRLPSFCEICGSDFEDARNEPGRFRFTNKDVCSACILKWKKVEPELL